MHQTGRRPCHDARARKWPVRDSVDDNEISSWRRANHAVVRVEGPERIAMEWWRQQGHALTRDYFRVEDEEGRRFWIFRDGLYERELADEQGKPTPANWYLHGLFA